MSFIQINMNNYIFYIINIYINDNAIIPKLLAHAFLI